MRKLKTEFRALDFKDGGANFAGWQAQRKDGVTVGLVHWVVQGTAWRFFSQAGNLDRDELLDLAEFMDRLVKARR